MSFLLVAGLSVRCPACDATRWIPKKVGPAHLQVGDQNVVIQSEIQNPTLFGGKSFLSAT